MGFGRYRFRRSFGQVNSQFRGARPSTYPNFQGLLDLYPGAAAAYSLRALSSGWLAGDVVEVRPSSGWTPASFTANQVANGDLVDYVKRPGNFTNSGFQTFSNNGTGDGFTATLSSGVGLAISSTVSGGALDEVTILFDLDLVSGSPSLNLRNGVNVSSNSEIFSTSGSKSATLTATGTFDNFTFGEGDAPSEFTISNVRVSTNDGFVSTWYDQSGNANDATQITTTSQPKIVSAGSLVTGGLNFDGVDDFFDSNPSLTQPVSIFGVYKALTNDSPITGASPSSLVISRRGSGRYIMFSGTVLATGFHPSTEVLASCIFDGATSTGHWNGIEILSGDAGALSNLDYIGRNATSYLDGTMSEIIIYNFNQSANRVAIETNINDAYSIF